MIRLHHLTLLASLCAAAALPLRSDVQVANFSSRALVGEGNDQLILGIVVTGTTQDYRPVLLRGIGPWLTEFGVTNVIDDPVVTLYESMSPASRSAATTTG